MNLRNRWSLAAVAAGIVLFVACDKQPLSPARVPSPTDSVGGSLTVPPSSVSITIVPGAEVYQVGQTAHFTVSLLKDGLPLNGSSSTTTATFPNTTTPVALTATGTGTYAFDAVLTAPGQVTLTVSVLHDYAGALDATERNITRIEVELAALKAELAGATNENERRVLEVKIANREAMLARLRETLATMQTPQVTNASTVTVLPSDTTAPVFGRRWPERSNGATWIANALTPIEVEVSDADSGVDNVVLRINDGSPIAMVYDAALQRYRYQPTLPWPEGGPQSVLFIARDLAGNEASLGFIFTADYTPARVLSFSPETTDDTTPLITVVVTDDLAGIRTSRLGLKLDGQPVPFVWSSSGRDVIVSYQVQSPLFRGVHTVDVVAEDYAGNLLEMTLHIAVR